MCSRKRLSEGLDGLGCRVGVDQLLWDRNGSFIDFDCRAEREPPKRDELTLQPPQSGLDFTLFFLNTKRERFPLKIMISRLRKLIPLAQFIPAEVVLPRLVLLGVI